MTAQDFKIEAYKFRMKLMEERDQSGVPVHMKVPELRAQLHYETWRDILETCEVSDFIQLDRFFGCTIQETAIVPVGEVRFSIL